MVNTKKPTIYPDQLLYSPLDFASYRQELAKNLGLKLTSSSDQASIIASSYLRVLKKHINRFGSKKKYLLWTHEPYHDITQTSEVTYQQTRIQIMNCYTGDVFTHNFRYFYFRNPCPSLTENPNPFSPSDPPPPTALLHSKTNPPKIVALSTYYQPEYYQNNPHTILSLRYQAIEEGYRRKILKVYGKNWEKHPENIKPEGESRNRGDRRKTKAEILQNFQYNLCLENTNMPYYVTEKIWEPIKHGVLPIYYSNQTINQVFPPKSFLDLNLEFNQSPTQLFDYLEHQITAEEYYQRLKLCRETFNQVIANQQNNPKRLKSDNNPNINYLEYDTCYQELEAKLKKLLN